MDCLIISGMSGAGKSLTVDVLEDIGYYCVDNMPVKLIPTFVELFVDNSAKYKKVAFVVDVRSDGDFEQLFSTMDGYKPTDIDFKMLFLDCSDEKLVNRYKETRRRHPLDTDRKGIVASIAEERKMLEEVKYRADYSIDTTSLSSHDLRRHLTNLFGEDGGKPLMHISVNSFGFKYGIPHESDMVFDVRFIDNPYYIPELRDKTGIESDVSGYVFKGEAAKAFSNKVLDLLELIIPHFIEEGKTSMVVSIGCTGGKHRSVAMAEKISGELLAREHNVTLRHRDIQKG